jgi:hypothetical protein
MKNMAHKDSNLQAAAPKPSLLTTQTSPRLVSIGALLLLLSLQSVCRGKNIKIFELFK